MGMVAIPIKLYVATESKDFSFVTLHTECKTRLNHKRYCPYHEVLVESSEISRAYEYAKEQYVVMEDSDTIINMTFSPPVALLGLLAENPLVVAVSEEPPPKPGVPDSRRLRVILVTA